jgi:hypothetical protein
MSILKRKVSCPIRAHKHSGGPARSACVPAVAGTAGLQPYPDSARRSDDLVSGAHSARIDCPRCLTYRCAGHTLHGTASTAEEEVAWRHDSDDHRFCQPPCDWALTVHPAVLAAVSAVPPLTSR